MRLNASSEPPAPPPRVHHRPPLGIAARPEEITSIELAVDTADPAHARAGVILAAQRQQRDTQIRYGPLLLDRSAWQAWWEETPLLLTSQQFQLLEALADAGGTTVTPQQLAHALYRHRGNGDTAAIRAHIGRLQQRLRPIAPGVADAVLTVRGQGYRLAIPQQLDDQHASADRSR